MGKKIRSKRNIRSKRRVRRNNRKISLRKKSYKRKTIKRKNIRRTYKGGWSLFGRRTPEQEEILKEFKKLQPKAPEKPQKENVHKRFRPYPNGSPYVILDVGMAITHGLVNYDSHKSFWDRRTYTNKCLNCGTTLGFMTERDRCISCKGEYCGNCVTKVPYIKVDIKRVDDVNTIETGVSQEDAGYMISNHWYCNPDDKRIVKWEIWQNGSWHELSDVDSFELERSYDKYNHYKQYDYEVDIVWKQELDEDKKLVARVGDSDLGMKAYIQVKDFSISKSRKYFMWIYENTPSYPIRRKWGGALNLKKPFCDTCYKRAVLLAQIFNNNYRANKLKIKLLISPDTCPQKKEGGYVECYTKYGKSEYSLDKDLDTGRGPVLSWYVNKNDLPDWSKTPMNWVLPGYKDSIGLPNPH